MPDFPSRGSINLRRGCQAQEQRSGFKIPAILLRIMSLRLCKTVRLKLGNQQLYLKDCVLTGVGLRFGFPRTSQGHVLPTVDPRVGFQSPVSELYRITRVSYPSSYSLKICAIALGGLRYPMCVGYIRISPALRVLSGVPFHDKDHALFTLCIVSSCWSPSY